MRLNKLFRNSVLFCLLLFGENAIAQLNTYTFEKLDSLQKIEERPVFIFFHTDWCKYCLAMEQNVFSNDEVIELINNNFYFISFDAEQKESVTHDGETFEYESNGVNSGKNTIVYRYAKDNGEVRFPSLVFLWKSKTIYQENSYLNKEELIQILTKISNL
ncbi:MAG: thioredoxin family protein [Brumimicrobium sp.]